MAFARLQQGSEPERVVERTRERGVIRDRLLRLCTETPTVAAAIRSGGWDFATPTRVMEEGSRDAARAATVMRSRSAARAAAGFCGIVNILVCRYRGYTAPGSAAPRCGAREPCVVHRARES